MAASKSPVGLILRKHADKSAGQQARDGSWPLAGVSILNDEIPQRIILTPGKIAEGLSEEWITAEGGTPVVRPAGPTQDVLMSTHTQMPHVFMHYDSIVIHTLDGDVAYKVVHQPDKYVDSDNPREKVTKEKYAAGNTRVDNFYVLELEG